MCDFSKYPANLSQKAQDLEVKLYLEEHARISRYLSGRHGLDFDQADIVAGAARCRYVHLAVDKAQTGSADFLEKSEEHRSCLYGTLTSQSVVDEVRQLKTKSWRNESINDENAANRIERFDHERQNDPYRMMLAEWCQARLPRFFGLLREGVLAPIFDRLRLLAHDLGCISLTEEFVFLTRYLFNSTSEEGDPVRAELTRRLNMYPERTGNSREVAICKLRSRLQARWSEVESEVFHKPHVDGQHACTKQQSRRMRSPWMETAGPQEEAT
jgi:hypothetical protein